MTTPPGAAPPPEPATDFFAVQDAARTRARRFFALFGLCVLATAAVGGGFLLLIAGWFAMAEGQRAGVIMPTIGQAIATLPPVWMGGSFLLALLLIFGGSQARIKQLQRGADTLAGSIGARPVPVDATLAPERQMRNVLDEMALAAGALPPALFVLEGERSINAFAGTSAGEPFIVVTQGAMERLERDEQQALLAWSMALLSNGDAAINLRLIGWLAGLTVIVDLGHTIAQIPIFILKVGDGSDNSDANKLRIGVFFLSLPFAFVGLVIGAIGYAGLLLARMLRSRVSFHRVYLADATAVQFTRDPLAVRDLLRKIEADPARGWLTASFKEEFGPLLLAPGVQRLCLRTHPGFPRRIARLEKR